MNKKIQKGLFLILWIFLFFVYRISLFKNGIVEHVVNGRHDKDIYDVIFIVFSLIIALIYIFLSKKKQKK